MLFDYKLNRYRCNLIFFSKMIDIFISNSRQGITSCFFINAIYYKYSSFFVFKLLKIKFIQTIFIMIVFSN